MAMDFMNSSDVVACLHVCVMVAFPLVSPRLKRESASQLYAAQLTCGAMMVQGLARILIARLADQCCAARLFGWVSFGTTVVQWLLLIFVEQTTGFCFIDGAPSALGLVLMFVVLFVQGHVFAGSNGYNAAALTMKVLAFPLLGGTHMLLHSPQAGRLLLAPLEFWCALVLVCVICTSISLVQLHGRRLHFAQLEAVVEQLEVRCDRLHYQVRFAESHAPAASLAGGGGRLDESGSSYGFAESHATAASLAGGGGRWYKSGSSYGTNSEVAALTPSAERGRCRNESANSGKDGHEDGASRNGLPMEPPVRQLRSPPRVSRRLQRVAAMMGPRDTPLE